MPFIQHCNRILKIGAMALWPSLAAPNMQAQSLKLPEGTGMATTQKVCGSCHGAELVIDTDRLTAGLGAWLNDPAAALRVADAARTPGDQRSLAL